MYAYICLIGELQYLMCISVSLNMMSSKYFPQKDKSKRYGYNSYIYLLYILVYSFCTLYYRYLNNLYSTVFTSGCELRAYDQRKVGHYFIFVGQKLSNLQILNGDVWS